MYGLRGPSYYGVQVMLSKLQLVNLIAKNDTSTMYMYILLYNEVFYFNTLISILNKNTVQALTHPSADVVTQNGHKFDTTAANKLCQ